MRRGAGDTNEVCLDTFDENSFDDQGKSDREGEEDILYLRVKSLKDVEIHARPSDSVALVKEMVLTALDKCPNDSQQRQPYVRLIAAGRLLAPDTAQLKEFGGCVRSGSVVHAVVSNKRGAQAAAAEPSLSLRALRGTGIDTAGRAVVRSDQADDEESDSDNETNDIETGLSRRMRRLGFDRLRDSIGFRRSEVSSIRAYFSRSVDQWVRDNPAQAAEATVGEADLVRRRLLQEDAWMLAQGPSSEFRLNLNGLSAASAALRRNGWRNRGGDSISLGTDRDFLYGFIQGFFVEVWMLLFVGFPTIPHKQKIGILSGISAKFVLRIFQEPDRDVADELVLSDY